MATDVRSCIIMEIVMENRCTFSKESHVKSPEDKFCRSICLKTGLFVGRAERNINEAYTFIIYISSEFTGTTYICVHCMG